MSRTTTVNHSPFRLANRFAFNAAWAFLTFTNAAWRFALLALNPPLLPILARYWAGVSAGDGVSMIASLGLRGINASRFK